MTMVFLASLLLLAWTYVGYPLALVVRARFAPRHPVLADWEPSVEVVVVTHNAAHELRARLANLAALDYPPARLHIHIVSDGSTDASAAILGGDLPANVSVHLYPQRRGKSACLAQVIACLRAEVVLFADTRQRIEAGALRALLRRLSDPSVGAVGGELMFEHAENDFGNGVDFYWRYEKFIREHEARSGSVVGVSGALYAARRAVLPPIPAGLILDDVWIPLHIAGAGRRVLFAPDARAWDRPSTHPALEARRKRRTLAGNFQLIAREPTLLLPWKHPLGWRLWGHKWLRLLAPWCLLAAFASNLVLAARSPAWLALLLAQCVFYLCAIAGIRRAALLAFQPLRVCATFVRMNAYAMLALADFLRGRVAPLWHVTGQPDRSAP